MDPNRAIDGLARALGHFGMDCRVDGVPGILIVRNPSLDTDITVSIRKGRDRTLRVNITGKYVGETKEKLKDEEATDAIARWAGVVVRQSLRSYARRVQR